MLKVTVVLTENLKTNYYVKQTNKTHILKISSILVMIKWNRKYAYQPL